MEYYFAWWNLENLFDLQHSADRPAWLQSRLASELDGWNANVLDTKLAQISRIVARLNAGEGPDILGVCEVENEAVLSKLAGKLNQALPQRRYQVVHSDTLDQRGIDIAFVYDNRRFNKPRDRDVFNYVVLKRNATRDLLQVNFRTAGSNKKDLVVIGNHWPSRLGGVLGSEPYRIIAAETLSYWLERIPEKMGREPPILVMGDFNDEPFDRSVAEYALGLKDSSRVRSWRSRKPYLLNLMWRLQEDGVGTHFYDSWGMLDQLLVNRALLKGDAGIELVAGSAEIYQDSDLIKANKPRRFSRPSEGNRYDPGGFSDHLPIGLRCRRLD